MVRETLQLNYMKRELRNRCLWRDVVAEFLMTFVLMSVQAAVPLSWGTSDGYLGGPVQVALGVGFVVVTMAWALGDFGGGHINPAVSIAMMAAGKISPIRAALYIVGQCAGALAGAGFIYGVTPDESRGSLSATTLADNVHSHQGFFIEVFLTFQLVVTIFGSTNQRRKGNVFMPTIPIGFSVVLGILAGFKSTGASMNPARSLGPAVVMGIWDDHWVYWAGPIVGGLIATAVYHILDRTDRRESLESYELNSPASQESIEKM